MTDREKRSASSPLQEETSTGDKRFRSLSPGSLDDSEATIITGDLLSSTMLDEHSPGAAAENTAMVEMLQRAFKDPGVAGVISAAVAQQLKSEFSALREEVASLQKQLVQRDEVIRKLEEKVEDLEQYQRRNNIRISGVPEEASEDTDGLVLKIAEAIGCDLESWQIDRSHRVGRKDGQVPRPILVKFTSYKQKNSIVRSRKNLKNKTGPSILPKLNWLLTRGGNGQGDVAGRGNKIFINDDLTAVRSKVAAAARARKRERTVDETWVKDGVVFVKVNDNVHRVQTMRQLSAIA